MSTEPNVPDAKIVREIARDCVADYIDDARDIAAHVMGHFGMGVPGDVYAWTDAVRADLRAVVPSWPDEQPQNERDALAEVTAELESANANAAEIHKQRAEYREEIMRLRARVRELEAAQSERDGDVRAVARAIDLIRGLAYSDDPREDTAYVLDELDERFGPAIAALEARDAKAGG